MELKDRIKAFSNLGQQLRLWLSERSEGVDNPLDSVLRRTFHANGWFDESQVLSSLNEIVEWLQEDKLQEWTADYDFGAVKNAKRVGVIMAGNIPLVGYHDYLSVIISGHFLKAKLSSKDTVLIQFLHDELLKIAPELSEMVDLGGERFTDIDAVIATGSNNSSRYFDYYFSKIPHIIRKNRTSVAVLSGNESEVELKQLGNDIFRYYGLGCRNVTKVYFPKDFDINWFYQGIVSHGKVMDNHKYQNNYDYHKSLFLLNQEKMWDNNFLILKNDSGLTSPVGTLFYEEYDDLGHVEADLSMLEEQIQCRVGLGGLELGKAQKPKLTDYSDNIDVLEFLLEL
ncbi:acyl-CoA reductase [bacterium SCSIO 12643]|nr:acyl-CoA reductase [bacterium SCSIO 12643]